MATTGHESEAINVQGLKASLQKLKTDHIDGKADEATTLAGYGITDAYTKTEVNGLVDSPHQNYVTVEDYASLPSTGQAADTIYRVSNYNGSTSQVDTASYSEYAWDGSQYVFLCVKSQIGEVFDISVYNNNAKYANLAAALNGGANIPQSLQKGGMSVKFVQSSDNKYVQYRLIADEFTTDTTQWAIADEGVYVDNPEFVYVKTDAEDKILWAIKKDGTIFYGAGVPPQIGEYIQQKINEYHGDDIVAFLGDLVEGDDTLKALLDKKMDGEYIENPEWIRVLVDAQDRIIAGVKKDGNVYINKIEGLSEEVQEIVNTLFANKSTLDKFSESGGQLLWNGSSIEGDGITQAEADIRYAAKSIESTVADIEDSLDVNPPAVVALRNEIDQTEARVDNIENTLGITPPTLSLYKKITTETIITQAELNSWDGHVVEIIADLVLTGNSNFGIPSNCVLFFNGGRFVSDGYTGTLTMNYCYVEAGPYQIFDPSISSPGAVKADVGFAEWFGAQGDGTTFCASAFNLYGTRVRSNKLNLLPNRTYILESAITLNDVSLNGFYATLKRNPVWVDVPITSAVTYDSNNPNKLTFTVDTSSADYSKLKIGMGASLIDRTNQSTQGVDPKQKQNSALITEISGSSVTILFERNISSSTNYAANTLSLTNSFTLITLLGANTSISKAKIKGGRDIYNIDRVSWWNGASIFAGNDEAKNIKVEDCIIYDSVADAIVVAGMNSNIKHNFIIHAGANGIHLTQTNGIVIEDNYIYDTNINVGNNTTTHPGTGHNEGAITYSNSIANVYITNNRFDTCRNGIGSIDSCDNCKSIITNNTFIYFRENGIQGVAYNIASPLNEVYRDYIISNNRFSAAEQDYIIGGTYEEQKDIAHFYPPVGSRVEASGYAILFDAVSQDWENVVISSNIFRDCGILLKNAVQVNIENNIFRDLHTFNSPKTNMIRITDSYGLIEGNNFCSESNQKTSFIRGTGGKIGVIGNFKKDSTIPFVDVTSSDITEYNNV